MHAQLIAFLCTTHCWGRSRTTWKLTIPGIRRLNRDPFRDGDRQSQTVPIFGNQPPAHFSVLRKDIVRGFDPLMAGKAGLTAIVDDALGRAAAGKGLETPAAGCRETIGVVFHDADEFALALLECPAQGRAERGQAEGPSCRAHYPRGDTIPGCTKRPSNQLLVPDMIARCLSGLPR